MINIKYFNKFSELKLEQDSLIFLDNKEDKEYLKSIGFNCININDLHREFNKNEEVFIDELNKLLFIATKLGKEFDETIIEIGNFITEFFIYNLEEKLEKNLNINHKNLEIIKDIYKSYQEYKKENNYYDILDGLNKTIENYNTAKTAIYFYNINYIDEKRFNIIEKIISLSEKVFILKEKDTNLSYFEKQLKPKIKKEYNLKAKSKTLETKLSILHFLELYKKQNEENIGIFIINDTEFNSVIENIKHIELNFIYSLLRIREDKFNVYDIDNVLLFLNKHEERKKLFTAVKTAKVFKNINDIDSFFQSKELSNILNTLKTSKNKVINNLIMEFKFEFLEKIEKYLNILPDENFADNFKNVLFLYLAKKEKIKNVLGMERIPFSKIKEKDKVFVLYGGIKKQKDSFLADNHRKQLGLVHSELYTQLQLEYISNLAEFDNVVILNYKYNVNEVNEDILPIELEEFEANVKLNINKDIELVHKIDYSQIIQEQLSNINLNDMHLLIDDKNKIIENYLELKHDYLLNLNDIEIEKYLRNILMEIFGSETILEDIKNNKIEDILKNINKKLNYILNSNYPVKFKSKILFFKNKLQKYLYEEVQRFQNIKAIENNVLFQIDYSISEFNKKRIGIDIEIDRIDYYSDDKVDIVFYNKEPFTWYNKYHKTKILKQLLGLKGLVVKDIKYFGLY